MNQSPDISNVIKGLLQISKSWVSVDEKTTTHALIEQLANAPHENGLKIHWYKEIVNNNYILWTQLSHESGQFIRSASHIPLDVPQDVLLPIIENHKKIDTINLLGWCVGIEHPFVRVDGTKISYERKAQQKEVPVINAAQYEDLMWELDGMPETVKSITKYYNISSLADLPSPEIPTVKARIREIKRLQKN